MSFNVNRFRGAFSGAKQDYVVAPANYFEVQFMDLPKAFNSAFKSFAGKDKSVQKQLANDSFNNMRFRCHHADIPAKMLTPMARGGFMGPNRQMSSGTATFAPLQLDFLETPRFNLRAFFDAWTELAEGYQNGYITEYYDDIIMPEINIVLFSRDGKKIARWALYDCWPSSVTHSSLAWDSVNSNVTVGAEIMYHRWESFWYNVSKNDCSIDSDDLPPPTIKSAPVARPPQRTETPTLSTHPEPPKNQILRNEWGEPYIINGENQGKTKLSTVDTTKYESRVIDTSSWVGKDKAPQNKI